LSFAWWLSSNAITKKLASARILRMWSRRMPQFFLALSELWGYLFF
jgi:hypothetical protein